ncbi:copper amine oxidase N-terminal domain-containing protein [Brevibacillus sp. NSP2.1]|uniref:copper amine oxidase N-terminal domain-containing protein n=1 Tax=Brevibacillus sp. NSP2.1 TaxID=3003229 RepID=UPI000427BB4D|nr:copper amine oxidase N-terminal domain-containing protein [Brevibacillus sp. NSP2.1]QHZ57997.1 copper amine oxidase N-terminal domain-containing protein [Brevibacillus sp. NSP2.1]
MKKLQRVGLLTFLLSAAPFSFAQSAPQVQVAVNGEYVTFPDALPYVNPSTQRTMVPARFVAEKLGLGMQWNPQTSQVTLRKEPDTIQLTIGQDYALVNGKKVHFDAPAVLRSNRTMVPLRFISELFDARIEWLAERNLVAITTSGHASAVPPASVPPAPDSTWQHRRSTWLWDASLLYTQQEQIIQFASEHQLSAIYLQIDRDIPPTVYQQFIRKAQEKQIAVEALEGRPQWAFPASHGELKAFINWVRAYNASVAAQERFAGLHFDIEPYILPEWKSNRDKIVQSWMDTVRLIEKDMRSSGLTLTLDIPFWLHQVKVPGTDYSLSAWMLEKADAVVIMDYRNVALGNDGIIANAHPILREAATLKKQVIVAVETAPSAEGPHTSFHALPLQTMKTELQLAKEHLEHYASFAGFAIHDYNHWVRLKQGGS